MRDARRDRVIGAAAVGRQLEDGRIVGRNTYCGVFFATVVCVKERCAASCRTALCSNPKVSRIFSVRARSSARERLG